MASNHNPRCLWQPRDPSKTMLSKFRRFVNERHRLDLKNYQELWQYSIAVETANDFWVDAFVFLGLKGDVVPTIALAFRDRERFLPPPIWFPEVKLNFTEILLSGRDPQRVVLHTCTEGGNDVQDVTWGQLIAQVTRMADAMKSSGVVQGDRVAGVLSNRLETVIACLATLSMGAIWSTSSPDMGVEGVLDRVRQIRPKLLFVESDVLYNERILDQREKNRAYAKSMLVTSEFTNIVVIPRSQQVHEDPDLKLVSLDTFLKRAKGRPLDFKRLPFAHPGFIVYSSGTTGPPKCIVHSAAGLLLQSRKDSVLHFDVQPGDNILQYTTTGWIMWGKVICGIGYGGRTVIYDGSPLKPDPLVLLRLVSTLRITHFGTSARFLTQLKDSGLKPRGMIDLSCLKCVTSTGSTLTAEVSEWFYDVGFPRHVHLVSTSGGTDIAGSLVTGNPTLPLYSGEIQCETIGMATDIADAEATNAVSVKHTGQAGELVCRMPFPSQPTFWGEKTLDRYRASYFERYGDKIWFQGDFIQLNPKTHGFLMLGRSDGVLNPSGVRFGSAEIYEVVEKIPGIADSLCVAQRRPHDRDEIVVLFVKMAKGHKFTPRLKSTIATAIRTARTPRHVPKYIFQVPDIPYTINGKKIEQAVKAIISHGKSKPNGAVANPESFKYFERFYEIEKLAQAEPVLAKM
ncbi:acetoacetate-CoA ligase [Fonsecaea pedrosoi CBS 271.37]|uniref:Acetoacetate-CoA ligase n=1 Tax=Fonsecaea pedrosoi CBS 271.37 TaxID=1442368 RepID=A0A0D2H685_9EURO|nr:acetoacetate-CoA ligase [Fonsecaea pedrosoi CBS 271.37]KIW86365.1 acetoacetate-CoA ligase [Fonsecaea pedrosoi CBS 271.37]